MMRSDSQDRSMDTPRDQRSRDVPAQAAPASDTIEIVDENLRQGFAQVPRPVLRARGLSFKAKVVYVALLDYAWQKGSCFPGHATLARDLDVSHDTVERALAELKHYGLVNWRRLGLNKPNVYYLLRLNDNPNLQLIEREHAELRHPESAELRHQEPAELREEEYADEEYPPKNTHVNADANVEWEQGAQRIAGWKTAGSLLSASQERQDATSRVDWLANEVLGLAGDAHSLACYRAIAARCPQELVFEARSIVKEARREGRVRQNRGAMFIGVVRRLCSERGLDDPLPKPKPLTGDEPGAAGRASTKRVKAKKGPSWREVYDR